MNKPFITREISNEDIYNELQHIKEMGQKTFEQACKTNGRVLVLEKKSIGMWIGKHPFKFSLFVLAFFSLTISDLRHPLINFLIGLI